MEIRTFTPQEMARLLDIRAPVYLSMYLPMDGPTLRDKKMRAAKLLQKTEERIQAHPWGSERTQALLEPVRREIEAPEFWRKWHGTFILFRTPDEFLTFQVPVELKERVVLGHEFFIKPLLPALTWARPFYLLAVSQKQVRFLACTFDQFREIEVEGMPHNLQETLGDVEFEKQRQLRTVPSAHGAGGSETIHYGEGGERQKHQEQLERYLRLIDVAVRRTLPETHAPLVFAGVGYEFAMYQQLTAYPRLLPFPIKGNPDRTRAATLHARACDLLTDYFQEPKCEALARFRELHGVGRTFSDTESVLHAAQQGRVQDLFVNQTIREWGKFNPTNGQVIVSPRGDVGGTELSNLAAIQTLKNKGMVYALDAPEMPVPVAMAATLRY